MQDLVHFMVSAYVRDGDIKEAAASMGRLASKWLWWWGHPEASLHAHHTVLDIRLNRISWDWNDFTFLHGRLLLNSRMLDCNGLM